MQRPAAPFGPIATAIVTPFAEDGSVDYRAFWRLARHLTENGSDALVVAGTTGESPTLTTVEKVALFKTAVDAVGERATIVAGTGTYDTRESIELTERAIEAGVDGVMAVTPYYSKPPQEGLVRHFTAIADASAVPVMLYNIPGRTARLIEVETLATLADHENIVAVKDAVDDIEFTKAEIDALEGRMAVYSGSDIMTRSIVEAGGVGVVSVASHLAGPQIRRLVEAVIAGDVEESDRLQKALDPLFTSLFLEPNPMPLKAALNSVWDAVGEPRLPLIPASRDTVKLVEEALGIALDA